MQTTAEVCRTGEFCIFRPLCLFVHDKEENDQEAALIMNTVPELEVLRSKTVPEQKDKNRRDETLEDGEILDDTIERPTFAEAKEAELLSSRAEEREMARMDREVARKRELRSGATSCRNGPLCRWRPRCRFAHQEEAVVGAVESMAKMTLGKERKVLLSSPPRPRRDGKACRAGPACRWKPLCLFQHKEGGNDHKAAYSQFNARRGREERREKTVAKKVEKKFDWEGGSNYSNMLAWVEVAERVNEEALEDINGWMLDRFMQDQLQLLGGSEVLYERVDESLKELEVMESIEEEQRTLYNWRMDFFLDKFKSIHLGDDTSTWMTDGFDDNHCLDTIPMQITQNFDEVMSFAATNKNINADTERFFFAHDENVSYMAEQRFGDYIDDGEPGEDTIEEERNVLEKGLVVKSNADGRGRMIRG
jgi:hypothetical protein